ncbi:hypothetical protein CHS0354_037135 [Potamilus streckersoni]|uniref:Uncharacterized protein n=1 Tax=Potamilus streckersoni TaxID=2493646 RepID=A0AAE0RP17_9BIVA|nr:hypothetical protein CHS0354_037135 [Potamilus streckersoni]
MLKVNNIINYVHSFSISSELRTILQCKKQFDNIKQRAKEKLDGFKKPQTRGGSKPTDPPLSQQLILEQLGGRPQMCGLYACLDTEVEIRKRRYKKKSILTSRNQRTNARTKYIVQYLPRVNIS